MFKIVQNLKPSENIFRCNRQLSITCRFCKLWIFHPLKLHINKNNKCMSKFTIVWTKTILCSRLPLWTKKYFDFNMKLNSREFKFKKKNSFLFHHFLASYKTEYIYISVKLKGIISNLYNLFLSEIFTIFNN